MIIIFSIIASLIALGIAAWWAVGFKKILPKDEKIKEISEAIRVSARAYLAREYRTIAYVAAGIFVILFLIASIADDIEEIRWRRFNRREYSRKDLRQGENFFKDQSSKYPKYFE